MNATRWKLLMAYLPAVASVVNSFENAEVQAKVFDTLLGALDEKTQFERAWLSRSRCPEGRLPHRPPLPLSRTPTAASTSRTVRASIRSSARCASDAERVNRIPHPAARRKQR